MHQLLKRQVARYLRKDSLLSSNDLMSGFLQAIDSAYVEFERKLKHLEHLYDVQLKETNMELSSLQMAVDESAHVVVFNKQGRIAFINNNALSLTELTFDEVIYKRFYELFTVNNPHISDLISHEMAMQRKWKGEINIITGKGKSLWISGTLHPHAETDGSINKYIGIFFETTDLHKVKDEIQESQSRYSALVNTIQEVAYRKESIGITNASNLKPDTRARNKDEHENVRLNRIIEESPDYIAYYNLEGNLIYSNKAFRELRFRNNEETEQPLYPEWGELLHKRKAIPYALENGSWRGETAILDYNGREIPVLELILIHSDDAGKPAFRSSVMRDITQRKEYEEKLLLSEKRNRDLINYSQAIICTHDLEGQLLSINPAGCNLLQYSLEEMIGRPIADFMPSDVRSLFTNEYIPGFAKGRTMEGILNLLDRSGKKLHLLYKNYKVDEPGGNSYIIGFAQDITERIKAENELLDAKKNAEDSSRAKETFLANMSHEIRTPMNGIVGLTNLLIKTPLNEKQQQYARSVKNSAENLLVIINDILDFSKIQAGKLEILLSPVLLSDLLFNLYHSFRHEAIKKNIDFRIVLDDRINTGIMADMVRISQVLTNLISNAIKFTEKGQVRVDATAVYQNEKSIRIRFSVSDTGIGIENKKLSSIFESFTQVNSDTARKYGGTGLGLSIAKSMTELMNGNLTVNSEIGKGSVFQFEITFEKVSISKCPGLSEVNELENEDCLNGVKILLAEDNLINQLFAFELLTEWGAETDIAENGKMAVEMALTKKYDLILMDIQMPEMGGIEATALIRNDSNESLRSIPIIAMTANAMKGDKNSFKSAGMNSVIFKPYQSQELLDEINRYIPKNINPEHLQPQKLPMVKDEAETNRAFPETTVINLNVLKAFSKGKTEFIKKMIIALCESVPPTVVLLQESMKSMNLHEINRHAHKLIPNMNMMGSQVLESAIREMESLATEKGTEIKLLELWQGIESLLSVACQELQILRTYYQNQVTTG
jgi:PAS domain S-box-containing protein